VAALFCGVEVARFGRDRAQAQGRRPDLEALARVLPPSQSEALALASRAMTMGGAFALRWPVLESTRITSPFGLRTHPLLGTQQQHTGVDLAVPSGTPVHATGAGIVRRASEDAINGKVVIIDHGRGVTTAYCHNSELLVSAGDRVEAGQVISKSGTTGRSTGPHVHYQLELGGKPVDPLRFHRAELAPATSSVAID
jgi:murein DD-endopeptidase MepM/ murein hydrolase activator NlpD